MSAFAAFLLVLALLQLVGGVALWQLRGWGRIMVAALVALAIFMAGYIGIIAGWSMLVVLGILLQLAMLITLLSQGARDLCRGRS